MKSTHVTSGYRVYVAPQHLLHHPPALKNFWYSSQKESRGLGREEGEGMG